MSAGENERRLEAFRDQLPPFSGSAAITEAARGRTEVQDAAVAYLERVWITEPGSPSGLSAIALLTLASSEAQLRRFADRVLFRLPSPAGYRQLVPLLRDVVDDRGLADLIAGAMGSEDDQVAANALDLQYHGYGFPDRFRLPADRAALLDERLQELRARARPGGRLAAALARYTPPPTARP